jgi:hypothetical protein
MENILKIIKQNEEQKKTLEFHRELFSLTLKLLANYGWYISEDLKMNELTSMYRNAYEENVKELDNFFIQFYNDSLEKNTTSLSIRFKDRKIMFQEALSAHKNKYYHCSTLLWLTLCDSLCEGELFKLKGEKKAIKNFLQKNGTDEIHSKYLEVLTEVNAIDVFTGNKSNYISQLNRHGIVHGYDINYGTEVNSLKAFSLLVFIKDMVNRHKREI